MHEEGKGILLFALLRNIGCMLCLEVPINTAEVAMYNMLGNSKNGWAFGVFHALAVLAKTGPLLKVQCMLGEVRVVLT